MSLISQYHLFKNSQNANARNLLGKLGENAIVFYLIILKSPMNSIGYSSISC